MTSFCKNSKCQLGLNAVKASSGFGVKIKHAGIIITISNQNVNGSLYCDLCAKEVRERNYADEKRFQEAGKAAVEAKLSR